MRKGLDKEHAGFLEGYGLLVSIIASDTFRYALDSLKCRRLAVRKLCETRQVSCRILIGIRHLDIIDKLLVRLDDDFRIAQDLKRYKRGIAVRQRRGKLYIAGRKRHDRRTARSC